jgi:hypothetical protein
MLKIQKLWEYLRLKKKKVVVEELGGLRGFWLSSFVNLIIKVYVRNIKSVLK